MFVPCVDDELTNVSELTSEDKRKSKSKSAQGNKSIIYNERIHLHNYVLTLKKVDMC